MLNCPSRLFLEFENSLGNSRPCGPSCLVSSTKCRYRLRCVNKKKQHVQMSIQKSDTLSENILNWKYWSAHDGFTLFPLLTFARYKIKPFLARVVQRIWVNFLPVNIEKSSVENIEVFHRRFRCDIGLLRSLSKRFREVPCYAHFNRKHMSDRLKFILYNG